MSNYDRFGQNERGPNSSQTQIVVPENVAPLYQIEQFPERRLTYHWEIEFLAPFPAGLRHHRHLMIQAGKFLREQSAYCFYSANAWSESVR